MFGSFPAMSLILGVTSSKSLIRGSSYLFFFFTIVCNFSITLKRASLSTTGALC